MEKRVLLAVVLSFLVLYGYQALFPPPKPADTPATATSPQSSPVAPGATSTPGAAEQPAPQSAPAPIAERTPSAPVVADSTERDITFESPSVRAVFTTRGGALKSWRLKKYPGSC